MTIERVAATANDTLDQTSDTLINSMTITPASGDYICVFTGYFTTASSAGNDTNMFNVYVGGTIVDHSERQYDEDSSVDNTDCGIAVSCKVSPSGSQAVEIRHRASTASSPVVMKNREMNLFPIPTGTDYQQTATGNTTRASTTFDTLDSMTVTPVADDYMLIFGTSAYGGTDTEPEFRVSVGGTPVAHTVRRVRMESSWNNNPLPILICCSISPGGSDVVEIEWRNQNSSATVDAEERNMVLMPIASEDIFQATGTANDGSSSSSDILIDDMTITDPGADDYMVVFSAYDSTGSIGNNVIEIDYNIHNAGSRVTNSERTHEHEGSIDNTEIAVMAGGRVTVAGATDDLEMFWQNTAGTTARTIHERTMIAVREASAAPDVLSAQAWM